MEIEFLGYVIGFDPTIILGPGMFLAAHKDRLVCGSCKYVEFTSKKEETVEESKTE